MATTLGTGVLALWCRPLNIPGNRPSLADANITLQGGMGTCSSATVVVHTHTHTHTHTDTHTHTHPHIYTHTHTRMHNYAYLEDLNKPAFVDPNVEEATRRETTTTPPLPNTSWPTDCKDGFK